MKNFILTLVLLVALVGFTQAATVFTEDFESYTDGSVFDDPDWFVNMATYILADDGNVFTSPSNMYAEFLDDSTSGSLIISKGGFDLTDSVVSVSFDFYEPTSSTFGGQLVIWPRSSAGNECADVRFSNGSIQGSTETYTLDEPHHFDLVINLSNTSAGYSTGESVAGYRYDVWFDGVKVIDEKEFRDDPASTDSEVLNAVQFRVFSSNIQQIYVDNIVVRDTPYVQDARIAQNPVPEDDAANVDLAEVLSWDAGTDPATGNPVSVDEYYVYIAGPITDSSQVYDPNVFTDQNLSIASSIISETGSNGGSWTPPAAYLGTDTTYVWCVDQKLTGGTIVPGVNWSFTTIPSVPILNPELPADTTAGIGEDAELSVEATNPFTGDSTGLSYQWMYSQDGVSYSDVGTGPILSIDSAQATDQGYYYCDVTLDSNSETVSSRTAFLIVKETLAHWTLDQADYVGGVHLDIVGGHDADPNGEPTFVTGAGPDEPALGAAKIEADTDAVAGTWNPSETTGQVTVSAWINWDGSGLAQYGNDIIGKFDGYAPDTMMWSIRIRDINSGNAGIRFYNDSGLTVHPQGVIPPNTWTHVAATYAPGEGKVYINGELVATDANAALGTGTESVITIGGSGIFPGAMDEVMIHNYAMSPEDVATLYYQTSQESVCLYPPLVDLNDDCLTDLLDFAILAENWIYCGRVPAAGCD
ncbi:hypothetical protein STSP2_01259 [Anaerohalosphaera lusitana]|uniref:Ig-like domain-containing protein n=1 Tax=Anaerohalosphaera lusitana TaxID=1936003 RepID=A0A1U9NK44_9BACT|nr:LamG-like jellyroll fold domain-containing protein [Anaerohalosphaera lusitana]AQT68104.1 hypothetical protein STSP2_01259 [Anaerohalosphaera lusitana]